MAAATHPFSLWPAFISCISRSSSQHSFFFRAQPCRMPKLCLSKLTADLGLLEIITHLTQRGVWRDNISPEHPFLHSARAAPAPSGEKKGSWRAFALQTSPMVG